MKQCARCGYVPARDDARFCGKCGAQLPEGQAAVPPPRRANGVASAGARHVSSSTAIRDAEGQPTQEARRARHQLTDGVIAILSAFGAYLWLNSYYNSPRGFVAMENGDSGYYKLVWICGAVALLGVIRLVSGLAYEFKK
jgi:hypothetical protein